jgi:hypothetical protein
MGIHVTLEQCLDEDKQRTKYRWVDNTTNEPTSEWYYSIEEALDWVKNHDRAVDNSVDKL